MSENSPLCRHRMCVCGYVRGRSRLLPQRLISNQGKMRLPWYRGNGRRRFRNAQFRRALTGESVQADENSVWDKRWLNWCVFCFYTSGGVWGQIQFLLISSRRCIAFLSRVECSFSFNC